MDWDPAQYAIFAEQRARPFRDLLARVPHGTVRRIIDVGCGPATKTRWLLERWPDSRCLGIDSSAEMLASAKPHPRLRLIQADVRTWDPREPVDLVFSNAALHWVPDHDAVFGRLIGWLQQRGTIAVQMPGNFGAPTHTVPAALARDPRFAKHIGHLAERSWPVRTPAEYAAMLMGRGLHVDAWETTYVHPLRDTRAVTAWTKGSVLRPYLAALPEPLHAAFLKDVQAGYDEAYAGSSTLLSYRRIFVVASLD